MSLNSPVNLPSPRVSIPWREIGWWLSLGAPLYLLWLGCYLGPQVPKWADAPLFFTFAVLIVTTGIGSVIRLLQRFE